MDETWKAPHPCVLLGTWRNQWAYSCRQWLHQPATPSWGLRQGCQLSHTPVLTALWRVAPKSNKGKLQSKHMAGNVGHILLMGSVQLWTRLHIGPSSPGQGPQTRHHFIDLCKMCLMKGHRSAVSGVGRGIGKAEQWRGRERDLGLIDCRGLTGMHRCQLYVLSMHNLLHTNYTWMRLLKYLNI